MGIRLNMIYMKFEKKREKKYICLVKQSNRPLRNNLKKEKEQNDKKSRPIFALKLKPLLQKSFQMSQKGHNPIPNIDWLHLKHILNEPKWSGSLQEGSGQISFFAQNGQFRVFEISTKGTPP